MVGSTIGSRLLRCLSDFIGSVFVHSIGLRAVFVARVLLLVGRMDCSVAVGWMVFFFFIRSHVPSCRVAVGWISSLNSSAEFVVAQAVEKLLQYSVVVTTRLSV